MQIAYVLPLQLAYERMKRALFAPFDFVKWLVVGFAAWVAGLLDGGSGGWPGQWQAQTNPREFGRGVGRAVERFFSEPLALMVVIWIVLAALFVFVLFAWLSSRAKFVFLDNVVHDRAAIVEPWTRHAKEGNSLFLWRLGFALAVILGFAAVIAPSVLVLTWTGRSVAPLRFAAGISLVAFVSLGLVVILYVRFFLNQFVIPIMYRDRLRTNDAWRKFLPLMRRELASFVLCGLFVLAVSLAVLIVLAAFGCLTCCIGFFLLMVPYVGAVVLLPVSYTYRAFGPEFLAQFGPEYSVWAPAETAPPETVT